MENEEFCDPETGVCAPAPLSSEAPKDSVKLSDAEIIYIGDPMCSWCWGIAPALKELRDKYKGQGIGFKIVVGGLRPGTSDPWNDEMKNFLKHHWEQVTERSGQPFGYKLFDKESFDYNTEPPCRAAVAARPFLGVKELEFFSAIKKKFYVDSEDPGEETFYKSLCQDFDIDYEAFLNRFRSEEIRKETNDEFMLNRNWGVSGYPAVVLRKEKELFSIARGFSTIEEMSLQMDHLLEKVLI